MMAKFVISQIEEELLGNFYFYKIMSDLQKLNYTDACNSVLHISIKILKGK